MSKNLLETVVVNFDGPLMFTSELEMLGFNESGDVVLNHIASNSRMVMSAISVEDAHRMYIFDRTLHHTFDANKMYFDGVKAYQEYKVKAEFEKEMQSIKHIIDEVIIDNKLIITMDRDIYMSNGKLSTVYKILGYNENGCVILDIERMLKHKAYCVPMIVSYQPKTIDLYTEYPIVYTKRLDVETVEWFESKTQEYKECKAKQEQERITIQLDDMNKLVQMIREARQMITAGQLISEEGYLNDSEFVEELRSLCCSVFIRGDGSVNYPNISKVKKELDGTVDIFPGEKDSFGWLTGVLDINDDGEHMVVFG